MLFTEQKLVKYYKKALKKSSKIVPEVYSYKKIVIKGCIILHKNRS